MLPNAPAIKTFLFTDLAGSLISIGAILDALVAASKTKRRPSATLYPDYLVIQDPDGHIILTGHRGPDSKLWITDLDNPVNMALVPDRHALAAHGVPVRSIREVVQYYHQAFGCPAASTFLRAVRAFLTLPGLSYKQLCQHQDELISMATDKGHLDQQRQGLRSTNPSKQRRRRQQSPSDTDDDEDLLHTAASAQDADTVIRIPTEEERVAMDLTGKLHDTYIMVVYVKQMNYIKLIASKTRKPEDTAQAFRSCLEFLRKRDVLVSTVRMDNEISATFTAMLADEDVTPDFVPPGNHRRNEAERCIRTAKNHIIATLANTDPDFPMTAAKHLFEQAEITLNLLRPSACTTSKSAWEAMHGRPYDFNRHPIAPPGTRVIAHDNHRATWAPHGLEGFYVGPKLTGYRMFQVYLPRTRHVRTVDTLSWHFNRVETRSNCPHERLSAALKLVARALHALHPDDITATTVTDYRDAAEQAVTLGTQLTARVLAHDRDTARHRVDAPVQTLPPVIVPDSPAVTHQLVTAGESELPVDPAPEQRVATSQPEQRVATSQPEQRVATSQPEQRLAAPPRHSPAPTATPGATTAPRSRRASTEAATKTSRRRHRAKGSSRRVRLPSAAALERQSTAMAHTAVDLDENGNKLVYHRAKAGPDGAIWEKAASTEIIKLIESATGRWIKFATIPRGKKAAYYNPRCRIKMKEGKLVHRVRGTIGGDQIDFDGDTAAYTASMPTLKILLNAVVSTPGAKFATADIKDYYLGTPLVDKAGKPAVEYMCINLEHIPADVQAKYALADFAHTNGNVYMEISKSIYGLPQAGRQAQDRLVKHLKRHDFLQCRHTPSLFKHKTRDIAFTLVVDDFGIKYTHAEDLDHFLGVLRMQYEITEDRGSTQKYVGITIAHNREAKTMSLSMPGYIEKALGRFGMTDARKVSSPAVYTPPEYGAKITYDEVVDDTPITAAEKTRIQQIVGVLLFYARAVDPTMLCAVNKLASGQADPSATTLAQADRILQYACKYPNAAITLKASDMQLKCHSDASYLSEAYARSRAGGLLFLGDADITDGVFGAIDYISCIIGTVVASAAEAEYAALFLVGREAICASQTLTDLGFPQKAILIICDNQCAVGIANRSVKQKRSKSINMRYHWIRDQVDLEQIRIQWEPGATNLADFFTKNHPTKHHSTMRNIFVQDTTCPPVQHTCALAHVPQAFADTSNYYSCLS